jgi:hypothetical protein
MGCEKFGTQKSPVSFNKGKGGVENAGIHPGKIVSGVQTLCKSLPGTGNQYDGTSSGRRPG